MVGPESIAAVPALLRCTEDFRNTFRLELLNGKIDAFIYDLPFNAIANAEKGGGKIYHLDQPFTYEPLAWAVKKGDPDFLNWLNNFMFQVKNDGTYERIYNKWFGDDSWLKEIQ